MSFLLDIFGAIKDHEDPKMAQVLLKIDTKDREYFIEGGGIKITVSSSNSSVALPTCHTYTVEVKNGRCQDNTDSPFLVLPQGRCKRVLVVSFFFFFFFYNFLKYAVIQLPQVSFFFFFLSFFQRIRQKVFKFCAWFARYFEVAR